jgi:hypothetical protein
MLKVPGDHRNYSQNSGQCQDIKTVSGQWEDSKHDSFSTEGRTRVKPGGRQYTRTTLFLGYHFVLRFVPGDHF